jgi:hypothetical protein
MRYTLQSQVSNNALLFVVTIMVILSLACGTISSPVSKPALTPTAGLSDQIFSHENSLSPANSWNQPALVDKLYITPTEYLIEDEYTLEYTSGAEIVTPSPGAAFLWVHIIVENKGDNAQSPLYIFELYYKGEITNKITLGTYEPLPRSKLTLDKINPGIHLDGWILFEVPQDLSLSDVYFLARPVMQPVEFFAWHFPHD